MLHLFQSAISWTVVIYLSFSGAECMVISQKIDDKEQGPRVLLSVSSLASHTSDGTVTQRLLELNWYGAPDGMNDDPTSWVGLFNHDPDNGTDDPLEEVNTKDHPEGYYRTRIQFPVIEFHDDGLDDDCLGFWIGFVNLNKLVAKSCIRARPRWMYEMRDVIGNRKLTDIMLPGTHNSGSYEMYKAERYTPLFKYQMCQDEDIYNQLVYGNRFLDFRVSYKHVAGSKERYWITHGYLRTNNTARDVLLQVKRFLDATNEIVIIDFHLFYMGIMDSLVEQRHKEFIKLVTTIVGDYMMPRRFGFSTSLNEIWNSNKRLMVGYAAKQRMGNNLLYPEVFHLWGDVESIEDLKTFLDRNMCYYLHPGLWSAMAELTPKLSGILLDKYGGLRKMAQDINRHITIWYRERWWQCTNIVSTDFFLGNNIIEVSIESNRKKFTTNRLF